MFEDLFATPIYSEILTDDEISKEIGSIIDDVKFNLKEEWSQTHYLSTDFAPDSSCNILDEFNLVQFLRS